MRWKCRCSKLNLCWSLASCLLFINVQGVPCGSSWKPYNGSCFLLSDTNKNFAEARKYCFREGGFLASVRTGSEYSFLVKTIQLLGSSYQRVRWYIGLHQFEPHDNHKFRWLDGSVSRFRHWMGSQPNNVHERCTQLDGSAGFRWRDELCHQRSRFICRKDPGSSTCHEAADGAGYSWRPADGGEVSATECLEHCRGQGRTLAAPRRDTCYCPLPTELSPSVDREQCVQGSCGGMQHCGHRDLLLVFNLTTYPDLARNCEDLASAGVTSPGIYQFLPEDGLEPVFSNCFEGSSTTRKPNVVSSTASTRKTSTTSTTTTKKPRTKRTTTTTTTTTRKPRTRKTTTTTTTTTTTRRPKTTKTTKATTTTTKKPKIRKTTTTTTTTTTTKKPKTKRTTTTTTTTTPKPTTKKSTTTTTTTPKPTTKKSTTTTTTTHKPTTKKSIRTTTSTPKPTTKKSTTTSTTTTTTEHPTTEETTTTPMPTTSTALIVITTTEGTTTEAPTTTPVPTTTTTESPTTTTTEMPTTTTTELPTTTTEIPTTTTTEIPTTTTMSYLYSRTTDHYFPDLFDIGENVDPSNPGVKVNGPMGFGHGIYLGANSCLKLQDFFKNPEEEKCWMNPANCPNGFTLSFWAKVVFQSSAQERHYFLSTGGDENGTPGVGLYIKGIHLYVVVSTGEYVWTLQMTGQVHNNTWVNLALSWSDEVGLQFFVNGKRVAVVRYPDVVAKAAKPPLQPFELTVGCRRISAEKYDDFSDGKFDELGVWWRALQDEDKDVFLGGYDCNPETHPLACDTEVDALSENLADLDLSNPDILKNSATHLKGLFEDSSSPGGVKNSNGTNGPHLNASAQVDQLKLKVQKLRDRIDLVKTLFQKTSELREAVNDSSTYLSGVLKIQQGILDSLFGSVDPAVWRQLDETDDGALRLSREFESWAIKKVSQTPPDFNDMNIFTETDNIVTQTDQMMVHNFLNSKRYMSPAPRPGSDWKGPVARFEVPTDIYGDRTRTSQVQLYSVLYKNLHKTASLINSLTGKKTEGVHLASSVLSITVDPDYSKQALVNEPALIYFPHDKTVIPKIQTNDDEIVTKLTRYCVRWDKYLLTEGHPWSGGWTVKGCKVHNSTADYTYCLCSQLGRYSLLGVFRQINTGAEVMVVSIWIKLAVWFFYLLSLASLIYYIVLIVRKSTLHEQFHYIRFNTAVATLGALTSVFSTEFKHPKEACRILACFIHYFYLALGAWFIMEAHALYAAVLYGIIGGRERCYLLIGWGVPALLVGSFMGIYPEYGYGSRTMCIVFHSLEAKLIFFISVLAIGGVSFFWCILIIINLTHPIIKRPEIVHELSSATRALICVSFLYVLIWMFGKLAFFDLGLEVSITFYSLFLFSNSSLGIIVLVHFGGGSTHFRRAVLNQLNIKIKPKRNQIDPLHIYEIYQLDKITKTYIDN